MFENLTDKLDGVFKKITGRGKLSEANIQAALKEVRLALLEADVNYKVVKKLVEDITRRLMEKYNVVIKNYELWIMNYEWQAGKWESGKGRKWAGEKVGVWGECKYLVISNIKMTNLKIKRKDYAAEDKLQAWSLGEWMQGREVQPTDIIPISWFFSAPGGDDNKVSEL